MLVDQLRLLKAAVKPRRNTLGTVRVSWHEDDGGVVAALGV